MIALDYFLYDNRTSSPRGPDWGIKAAMGVLAARSDLRSEFIRYCGAIPAERAFLSGFGAALGGFRAGRGYLLCVTLESSDSHGRPSWAVFGLWCPDTATLQNVLSGDPVGAAMAVLGSEPPPAAIHVAATGASVRPIRLKSTGTTFHRFSSEATVREVSSILLGAIRAQTPLPNIIGITATSRLTALAQAGFDRVYSCPMDQRTEGALAQRLSPAEQDEPWPTVAESTPSVVLVQPAHPRPASFGIFLWSSVIATGVLTLLSFFIVDDTPADFSWGGTATEVSVPAPPSDTASNSEPGKPDANTALSEIRYQLDEFKELDPQALQQTRGFKTVVDVSVLPKNEPRRKRVSEAYARLLDVRERMVKREGRYVAYYFDEEGATTRDETLRLRKIAEILEQQPLGTEDCAALEEAFGFEFESRESVTRRWCDAIARLESAVPPSR
jgi:hypothetical protein